jgi:hypothetical protein
MERAASVPWLTTFTASPTWSNPDLVTIYVSARIKPSVAQVEAHPYMPEKELLEFCKKNDIVFWLSRRWVTE